MPPAQDAIQSKSIHNPSRSMFMSMPETVPRKLDKTNQSLRYSTAGVVRYEAFSDGYKVQGP